MRRFRGSHPLQSSLPAPASLDCLIANAPSAAGRALITAGLCRDKPSRHAFMAWARRPIQVVLDGVRQGYDVGAVLRLCDAFPCERLVICGRDNMRGARKLVQAAQGTQRWVSSWQQGDSAAEVVRAARAGGFQVIAVEQTSHAVSLDDFRPRTSMRLVLGSERTGVSQAVFDLADAAVAIPMKDMANLLNVATAAAIVLHALAREYQGVPSSKEISNDDFTLL